MFTIRHALYYSEIKIGDNIYLLNDSKEIKGKIEKISTSSIWINDGEKIIHLKYGDFEKYSICEENKKEIEPYKQTKRKKE